MTELTFLVDLLLNHKLPKATREAVAMRIKEVEGKVVAAPYNMGAPAFTARPIAAPAVIPAHMAGQSASTIAAMQRQEGVAPPRPDEQALIDAQSHGLSPIQSNPITITPPPTAPVAVIAQTPAAVAAMQARNETILAAAGAGAFTGKPEKGRPSPRKF